MLQIPEFYMGNFKVRMGMQTLKKKRDSPKQSNAKERKSHMESNKISFQEKV